MNTITYSSLIPSVHHLPRPPRVAVAMSGGVDSSTVAHLFKEAGYDVIGLFIKMWHPEGEEWESTRDNLCCDISTILSVKQVAAGMDIPLYVLDMAQEFKDAVVDNYIEEYDAGRTPNPCSRCNRYIKLGLLWEKAQEYGADYLATGHYIQSTSLDMLGQAIGNRQEARDKELLLPTASDLLPRLSRAVDQKKDQSYFLWEIDRAVIPRLLFPLGSVTKPEVREHARTAQIPVADKSESQGTCFIVDTNNRKFLTAFSQKLNTPGDIVDEEGNVLGTHKGLVFYTIGQREGLGSEVAGRYMKIRREKSKGKSPDGCSQCPCGKKCDGTCGSCRCDDTGLSSASAEGAQAGSSVKKRSRGREISNYDFSTEIAAHLARSDRGDAPKLYVKKIDVEHNRLIVAENDTLFSRDLSAHSLRVLDSALAGLVGQEILAQIRGGHQPDRATLTHLDIEKGTLRLAFLEPVRAITPGQSVVLFTGDRMLGGGVIG